ncbi:MAG TPA: hypothetical protein VG498_16115, partial [Terriglobales bacterium]|nr:hypothetical protein [Terriglobales bacterium]
MRNRILLAACCFLFCSAYIHAAKAHLVTLGPWIKVQLFLGPEADRVQPMKIRSLNVDGRSREFTIEEPHDVTDRVFVVRRAYRMNDALTSRPDWKWQRDGWLLVDRNTGRVSKINLPDFDPFYSVVSWFRDYAAYCGVTDGQKLYAVVAQLGQRKPVLRDYIGGAKAGDDPDSECAAPIWQKQPARVTFQPLRGQKRSYPMHLRSTEPEPAEEQGEQKES